MGPLQDPPSLQGLKVATDGELRNTEELSQRGHSDHLALL
jgi:hypothetical protein